MIDVTDDQVVKGPGDRQHVAFVQVDIHHLPIHILHAPRANLPSIFGWLVGTEPDACIVGNTSKGPGVTT